MTGCEEKLILCGLLLHIVCISVGSAAPQNSNAQDAPCTTNDKKPGTCVDLRSCKPLHDLVSQKIPRTPQSEDFFRKNKCGWNNNEPKVCCADTSTLPTDGDTTLSSRGSTIKSRPVNCGKSSKNTTEKVIGGRPSDLGNWPWMVALGYKKWSDPSIDFRCGASLITDEWLLTAAHCLIDIGNLQLETARLGDLNLDNNVKDGASPIDVPIKKTFIHPQYSNDRRNYDVALIQLKYPVTFNALIQPICLFSGAKYEKDEYYKRKSPYIAGWGVTESGTVSSELREASVGIQELKKCADKYSQIGGKLFTDNLLCAAAPGKDTCQGDSGGPLIFINTQEGTFYLGGIVSAGKDCATDYPGLYMKVAKFISWINEVTGFDF